MIDCNVFYYTVCMSLNGLKGYLKSGDLASVLNLFKPI